MMKIVVTFEADSVERLREQMEAFLGPKPVSILEAAHRARDEATKEPADNAMTRALAAKKAKRVVAPEPEKEKAPEPDPEVAADAMIEALEVEADQEDDPVTPDAEKAVAAQKLKDQQLSRLRDLFNAGKGSLVRELLAKYGDGAKVFPEVDAKHFPAIKVELDRELGAH